MAIYSLPKGTPEKEEVWGRVEEKFGFISMKAKVPMGPEEAMQRCVALPSSNSFTLKSLEGSGQMSWWEEKQAQRWGPAGLWPDLGPCGKQMAGQEARPGTLFFSPVVCHCWSSASLFPDPSPQLCSLDSLDSVLAPVMGISCISALSHNPSLLKEMLHWPPAQTVLSSCSLKKEFGPSPSSYSPHRVNIHQIFSLVLGGHTS